MKKNQNFYIIKITKKLYYEKKLKNQEIYIIKITKKYIMKKKAKKFTS